MEDNISTINMIKGDKRVCGSRTQNVHIRYVYAHKKVNDETIVVIYCPTEEMISNYHFKPLVSSLFRTHRNTLMGIASEQAVNYKCEYI